MTGFRRRRELGHRVKPQSLHRFAVQLSFARRRPEVSVSEGKKGLRLITDPWALTIEVQPHLPFPFQSLPADALEPRILRSQRTIDHLINALAETRILESHVR